MSKKFYTADWHLWHHNIIRYCDRPFASVEDMHEAIVSNMNDSVGKNDLLYILGDVSFYGGDKTREILDRIHGKKIFLIGNHDAKNMKDYPGWVEVCHYKEIRDKGKNIILCHYPIQSWNKAAHGSIHLHGHSHGNLPKPDHFDHHFQRGLRFDVGVDVWGFKPVSIDDILGQV
jgi:calcineurin-like phosphoesterase family protein